MALFLSPYLGQGTHGYSFRPRGLDQPDASAIDLRVDCTRADGGGMRFALLWLPVGIPDPVGAVKLADDYGEPTTAVMKQLANTRFGLDFSRDQTIQDLVETILLRPDNGHWHRLRPANGRIEAWLGSGTGKRKWVDDLVIAGGSISDNFNRANETPIASPWVELAGSTGDVNLSSNAITHSASGDLFLYHNNSGSGWNADQSSQFLYASQVGSNSDWGPAVRIGSASGITGYWYSQYGGGREVAKLISGSYSQIEVASGNSSVGTTYKIDIAGSTIRYYDNGVENANSPGTDTSLSTAGNGPGLFIYETGGSLDDFLATGEITGGGGNPYYAYAQQ